MILLASCGGSDTTTAEVGGANFTLAWQDKDQVNVAKQVTKGEICSTNGIDQIKVSYLNDTTIVQSQTFACSDGSGTVTGIPVGSYTLKVEGLTGGVVSWRGKLDDAVIEANKTTDHGTIMMLYVGLPRITPSAGANGNISPLTVQAVANGTTKTFTITPDNGYVTVTPIGGNCPQGTLNGTTYTTGLIVADCTVAPTFTNIFFNITPSAGLNGSISPSIAQTATSGATKQFTITPDNGYAVVTPIGGSCPQGILYGTDYTTGLIVADCTVAPIFSNIIFQVTPSAGINGSINPATSQTVVSGTVRQFAITPNSGYQIASVTGCDGNLSGTTYTTGSITGDCTITASFSQLPTYRISGTVATAANVGIEGVSVSLSGSGTTIASTNGSGFYSFVGAVDGPYTLTPLLNGYSFAPLSKTISVSGADLPGQDFTGTLKTYSISGSVTDGVSPLPGVTVTLTGSGSTATTTNSSGYYSFSGAQNGDYTLAPSKTDYTFSPATLAVTVNGADQSAMNFAATAIPTIPAAPSDLAATAVSSNLINLSWTDNAGNETGFRIERAESGGNYFQIATVAANVTTYKDTVPSASTTYFYRVQATSGVGDSGYSAEANATTLAAGAVTLPELVPVTGTFNFSIGKFEVTQREWLSVMPNNPSFNPACGLDCPVENVSWSEVQDFIITLNAQSGKKYRLPTEAEWQYAAQIGGFTYSGSNNADAVAWYSGNSGNATHQVGYLKQPNGFGIYDMSGNVWEWVSDWYNSSQSQRVIRGGGYNVPVEVLVTSYRLGFDLTQPNKALGFRLAM
ncbi:MAG: SUMF1/EgtB/PvdO family nonheme iron enzyme [Desulfuromonadaceae bacterium]